MAPQLIAAFIGAFVAISLGPVYKWFSATRAYYAHVSEVIRDFRESIAVIQAILATRRPPAMPVQGHLTKIGIPDELLTTKIIEIGSLSEENRRQALWLVNVLVNINRDVDSIVGLMEKENKGGFYKSLEELRDKLEKRSTKLRQQTPFLSITKPSPDPKVIFFDDGISVTVCRTCGKPQNP